MVWQIPSIEGWGDLFKGGGGGSSLEGGDLLKGGSS